MRTSKRAGPDADPLALAAARARALSYISTSTPQASVGGQVDGGARGTLRQRARSRGAASEAEERCNFRDACRQASSRLVAAPCGPSHATRRRRRVREARPSFLSPPRRDGSLRPPPAAEPPRASALGRASSPSVLASRATSPCSGARCKQSDSPASLRSGSGSAASSPTPSPLLRAPSTGRLLRRRPGVDGTIANGLSVDESTSFGGAHHAGLVSAAERKQQRVGETLIILW